RSRQSVTAASPELRSAADRNRLVQRIQGSQPLTGRRSSRVWSRAGAICECDLRLYEPLSSGVSLQVLRRPEAHAAEAARAQPASNRDSVWWLEERCNWWIPSDPGAAGCEDSKSVTQEEHLDRLSGRAVAAGSGAIRHGRSTARGTENAAQRVARTPRCMRLGPAPYLTTPQLLAVAAILRAR